MHKTFSRVAHLFQTDASGCRRLEIKSKLIGKSSRVHRVDRYPDGNLCENILACLACVVDNLAPALCVMPLSMYCAWSRFTTWKLILQSIPKNIYKICLFSQFPKTCKSTRLPGWDQDLLQAKTTSSILRTQQTRCWTWNSSHKRRLKRRKSTCESEISC